MPWLAPACSLLHKPFNQLTHFPFYSSPTQQIHTLTTSTQLHHIRTTTSQITLWLCGATTTNNTTMAEQQRHQEMVAEFCAITDAAPEVAEAFLSGSDWELSTAVDLFFNDPGAAPQPFAALPQHQQPAMMPASTAAGAEAAAAAARAGWCSSQRCLVGSMHACTHNNNASPADDPMPCCLVSACSLQANSKSMWR